MSYDAFLSYSHRTDQGLAKALQKTLQGWGMATPGRRRLRVFRDESNLAANPDLWGSIERAIEQSSYFILLASPSSAQSSWVARELTCFLEHRRAQVDSDLALMRSVGIAWTGGTLPWGLEAAGRSKDGAALRDGGGVADGGEAGRNGVDPDCALSPEVLRLFPEEPLVVDLRALESRGKRALLASRAASFVAAILQRDKDEVFGDHLRAQRRFVAGLLGGIVVLLGALGVAVWQFQVAREQARRADERAREAIARRIAAESERLAESSPATSLLLLAQSYRMADSPAVRASWWQQLDARDMPALFVGERSREVTFSEEGAFCATPVSAAAADFGGGGEKLCYKLVAGRWRRDEAADVPLPEVTETWSGKCDAWDESNGVCECGRTESRIIGPYGDTDDFCVASAVTFAPWCEGSRVQVPGIQVDLEQRGRWLVLRTESANATFLCSNGDGDGARSPLLIHGSVDNFSEDAALPMLRLRGAEPVELAQSPDGAWLGVLRRDGSAELWARSEADRSAQRRGRTPIETSSAVHAIAAATDRDLAAIAVGPGDPARGGDLLLAHLDDGMQRTLVAGGWNEHRSGAIVLSSSGDLLAGGVDVEVGTWPTTNEEASQLGEAAYIGRNRLLALDLTPNGQQLALALAPLDGALPPGAALFEVGQSQQRGRLGDAVTDVAFLDDATLFTAGAAGVERWRLDETREPEARLLDERARDLALDRGGHRLAVALESEELMVWDLRRSELPEGTPLARSRRRAGKTTAIAFVRDQPLLLRASDRGLEAWHWQQDSWFTIDTTPFDDVATASGQRAVGLSEGRAITYTFDPDGWLELTCQLVRRNLTRDEWNDQIGEAFPYQCTCEQWCANDGSAAGM